MKQTVRQPDSTTPAPTPAARPADSLLADISRQADKLLHNDRPEAAAQALERGLRIAPKDGYLWSQLAEVRLAQHRYGQALSLAKKSNSLAQGNRPLIRRNQQIMVQAENQLK
jgi:cytochrome c-type biogenesis protein CcmH/NrfG